MLQRTSARTLRLEADSPPRNLGELPGPALLPVSQLREASQCPPQHPGAPGRAQTGSPASDWRGAVPDRSADKTRPGRLLERNALHTGLEGQGRPRTPEPRSAGAFLVYTPHPPLHQRLPGSLSPGGVLFSQGQTQEQGCGKWAWGLRNPGNNLKGEGTWVWPGGPLEWRPWQDPLCPGLLLALRGSGPKEVVSNCP